MFKQVILISAFFLLINAKYNGIDVNVWQGDDIDFKKVKKDGKDFVIIRAGYGIGNVDKNFETNYKKAKKAGLNVGAYWYSKATGIMHSAAEANSFIETVKGKQFEYPLFYDMEYKNIFKEGKEEVSRMAQVFCNILERNKYYCGIFTSKEYFFDYFTSDALKKHPIWIADYKSSSINSDIYDMWQKSSKGKVPGI